MGNTWTKSDWRSKPRIQMPEYLDEAALTGVTDRLARYPLLVFAGEARRLTRALGEVAEGRSFLLQGGDCARALMNFRQI